MHDRRTIRAAIQMRFEYLSKTFMFPNCPAPILKKYRNLKGYITKNCRSCGDTACTICAFQNRSYLGEFEEEFKNALARESGAQGVLFDKKIEGRKSRDHTYHTFT
jgi:hypothetical protein